MNDYEISLAFQALQTLKFRMISLFLDNFLNERLVSSFREPALFIQKGEYTRRIRLCG